MLFAINVPQSKSVSIAFVSLKSSIFGLIATITARQISKSSVQQQCIESFVSFMSLMEIFFVLGVVIDVISLVYFYLSKSFKKIEYYVFYIYHLIFSFICIFGGINSGRQYTGCQVSKASYIAIAAAAIILQISVLVTMISNLFIVLKYLHFGSNIVWCFIWIATFDCHRVDFAVVSVIHMVLSLVNFVALLLYRWYGKSKGIVHFWKTSCVCSIFLMLLCYLVVLLGLTQEDLCQNGQFYAQLYERYGLFQLISPILVMAFLRNESGDPRETKIKRHNQVFIKINQHQFVDFSAKI